MMLRKFIFAIGVFLLSNQTLSNDLSGEYEGFIRGIFGWTNYKCHIKIQQRSPYKYYSLTYNGNKIKIARNIAREKYVQMNSVMEQGETKKIRLTEGSRFNTDLGFMETLLTVSEGKLVRISLHQEYMILFGRSKEICGRLTKKAPKIEAQIDE